LIASSVGWTDGRLVARSVDSDYIITLTVSTQWLRCELQTPPVTADIIFDIVISVLTQQHKNVCLINLRTKKKENETKQ